MDIHHVKGRFQYCHENSTEKEMLQYPTGVTVSQKISVNRSYVSSSYYVSISLLRRSTEQPIGVQAGHLPLNLISKLQGPVQRKQHCSRHTRETNCAATPPPKGAHMRAGHLFKHGRDRLLGAWSVTKAKKKESGRGCTNRVNSVCSD